MRDFVIYAFIGWLYGLVTLTLAPMFFPVAEDVIRSMLLWTFMPLLAGLLFDLRRELYRTIWSDQE